MSSTVITVPANLNGEGYIVLPRHLTRQLGVVNTAILSEIFQLAILKRKKEREEKSPRRGLFPEDFFLFPLRRLERSLQLSRFKITKSLNLLEKLGFIEVRRLHAKGRLHVKVTTTVEENKLVQKKTADVEKREVVFSKNFEQKRASVPKNSKTHIGYYLLDMGKPISGDPQERIALFGDEEIGDMGEEEGAWLSQVKKPSPHPLVEHWNTLPHVSKHRDPDTKRYKEAMKWLKKLTRSGLKRDISPEFASRYGITRDLVLKIWTKQEIVHVLEDLARLFHPNYEPVDKSYLPRDLGRLIYNPVTRTSHFLRVAARPPRPLAEVLPKPKSERGKKIAKAVEDAYQAAGRKIPVGDYPDLTRFYHEIESFYSSLRFDDFGLLKREFPTSVVLVDKYLAWIADKVKELGHGTFPPVFSLLPSSGGFWWRTFLHETEKSLGTPIRSNGSNGKKRAVMKRRKNRAG